MFELSKFDSFCVKCYSENCVQCKKNNPYYCLKCEKNSEKKYMWNGECKSSCLEGYTYQDDTNLNLHCVPCQSGCLECS